jgi:hypothetical protein
MDWTWKMTPDERIAAELTQLVHAFNGISGSLERLAIVAEKWYDKTYPVRVPRDAIVTRVPSNEDKLLEDLGASGDTELEDWLTLNKQAEEENLGPRERELVKKKTE